MNNSSNSSSTSSGAGMNKHVRHYYDTCVTARFRITNTVAIVFLVNDTNTNADTNADTDSIVGIYHSILN